MPCSPLGRGVGVLMDVNPTPCVLQGCHLSRARMESKMCAGWGSDLDPEAQAVSSRCGPISLQLLAGTRVRAMIMGTRARQPMTSAHRGR